MHLDRCELELASQGDISEERARALLSDKWKLRHQFARQVFPVLGMKQTRRQDKDIVKLENTFCWVEGKGLCFKPPGRSEQAPQVVVPVEDWESKVRLVFQQAGIIDSMKLSLRQRLPVDDLQNMITAFFQVR